MKSKGYTTFNPVIYRLYKKSMKGNNAQPPFGEWCLQLLGLREKGSNAWQKRIDLSVIAASCHWVSGRLDHFFLASGVSAFCHDAARRLTTEYFKPLTIMPECFVLHFPSRERDESILVRKGLISFASVNYGSEVFYIPKPEEGELENHIEALSECQRWLIRFLFGFSLYIDAFPDTVVPAKIEDVRHLNHYKGVRHMVRQHPAIAEEARGAVSPHWRRGHFRVLESDKFVNKRFQTVYVRGTFVKGRAFEVLDDTPKQAAV